MTVVLILLVVVGLVVLMCSRLGGQPMTVVPARVAVELHRIRRRFDVAFVKAQIEADAAGLRREIDKELDEPVQLLKDRPR